MEYHEFKSEFEEWPGTLRIPKWLNNQQVTNLLERRRALQEQTAPEEILSAPDVITEFWARLPILEIDIKVEQDPENVMQFPAPLTFWIMKETNEIASQLMTRVYSPFGSNGNST